MTGEASNKKTKAFLNVTELESSPAAELIANNVDLLTEIFLWLPVKSIIRFKSVSKHWLSLLSDSEFATMHITRSSRPSSILGLYFYIKEMFHYISLHSRCLHLPSLSFLDGVRPQSKIEVENSCNGLLLCYVIPHGDHYRQGVQYIVCNPTTKKYRLLPKPDGLRYHQVYGFLAFDPKKSSHHYKVVLLSRSAGIYIYSSQSLCWKKVLHDQYYDGYTYKRAFWNGAIHWLTSYKVLKRFNVDEEEIIAMPNPQRPKILSAFETIYLGECGGGLILIQSDFGCPGELIRILELKKDYIGWVVKCRVNLRPLIAKFPEMGKKGWFYDRCAILHAAEGEDERGIALILSTPQRIIAYYPKYKAWEQLLDQASFGSKHLGLLDYALPYTETFFPV